VLSPPNAGQHFGLVFPGSISFMGGNLARLAA
jgi:hypothetical protein